VWKPALTPIRRVDIFVRQADAMRKNRAKLPHVSSPIGTRSQEGWAWWFQTTATILPQADLRSAQLHAEALGQCFEDFLVGGVHFFGFEGAVGGAVLEAVGDGFFIAI